jgi:flagellar protein FliO/FliZ
MDLIDIVRYFGALFLVLALVGIAGVVVRRYGLPGVVGGKGRRIAIVESLLLGNKHRLFLVRCDGVEHMLVTSPQGATLINSAQVNPAHKGGPSAFEKMLSAPPADESEIA